MAAQSVPQEQNHILKSLSAEERARIFPHLELVALPSRQVLEDDAVILKHAYFPTDSIISLQQAMKNGALTETNFIGNEGVFGISLLSCQERLDMTALIRNAGSAYRLPIQLFQDELARCGALYAKILRLTEYLQRQAEQTLSCVRHHRIEQQLCRWLLLSMDRLPASLINMTQDQISNSLGVRREGVTEIAGKLHKLGIVDNKRGQIEVLDRLKLEQLSCECYKLASRRRKQLIIDLAEISALPVKQSARQLVEQSKVCLPLKNKLNDCMERRNRRDRRVLSSDRRLSKSRREQQEDRRRLERFF